jgi:hypothetical protein
MKKLIFLLLLIPTIAMVQPNLTGITDALRKGNADALGTYFSETVEIAVMDAEDRYAKKDAVTVMKSFFGKNKPTGYSQVHKGVSKGGNLHYSIGEMKTSSNSTYRVYLLLEGKGNGFVIQQLRIDEE